MAINWINIYANRYKGNEKILPLHYNAGRSANTYFENLQQAATRNVAGEINQQNNTGRTPLHIACENNDIEAVKILLQASNINVNIRQNQQATPLLLALMHNNHKIVHLLLLHKGLKVGSVYKCVAWIRKHAPGNTASVAAINNAYANILAAQVARTDHNVLPAATRVFSEPYLRQLIASFVGFHPTMLSNQIGATPNGEGTPFLNAFESSRLIMGPFMAPTNASATTEAPQPAAASTEAPVAIESSLTHSSK